ncbi:unnamed protein product, partial [Urochloa humidicola]
VPPPWGETSKALFLFNDWWVVRAKVAFDRTIWSAWNSIYFVVLCFLCLESPTTIYSESTFWPMLTVQTD